MKGYPNNMALRSYVCKKCRRPFRATAKAPFCPHCGRGKPWRGGIGGTRSRQSIRDREKYEARAGLMPGAGGIPEVEGG